MFFRTLLAGFVQREIQKQASDFLAAGFPSSSPTSDSAAASLASPDSIASSPPWPDIALLFALGIEAGGTIDKLQSARPFSGRHCRGHAGQLLGVPVLVVETGVGKEAAAQATAEVLEVAAPRLVVSAGLAGGLAAELARGQLLLVNEVANMAGEVLPLARSEVPSQSASTVAHTGRLLSAAQLVRTTAEKRQLGEQSGAVACDMETFAIAAACQAGKTNLVGVRLISDALNDELPAEIATLLGQKSLAGKMGAALGGLFRRPGLAKDLWRLQEEALQASDRLAEWLSALVKQLPPPS